MAEFSAISTLKKPKFAISSKLFQVVCWPNENTDAALSGHLNTALFFSLLVLCATDREGQLFSLHFVFFSLFLFCWHDMEENRKRSDRGGTATLNMAAEGSLPCQRD